MTLDVNIKKNKLSDGTKIESLKAPKPQKWVIFNLQFDWQQQKTVH